MGTVREANDQRWFALEAAIAQWTPATYSYGRELFGGCLESEYQEEDWCCLVECPECGRWRATQRNFECAEGGSLNQYSSLSCDACRFFETDYGY